MKIGAVDISSPFILAPMAAVNCTAFRMLCKENKAGLVYTQMFDVELIKNKNKREVKDILNITEPERPVSVQLIGKDEASIIKSVKLIEEFADIIDFNVGCSEKEFLAQGYGAHLLSNPALLENIVKKMVQATSKPVTVKMRIGIDAQKIIAVTLAKNLENAGVKAVCIHGRTAQQKLAKKVNWTIMKQVKEKLAIPVMANGDVTSYTQGLELLNKTTCDFVMIGRGARDRPWIFNPKKAQIDNSEIKEQILRFIELYNTYEHRGSSQEVREHVFWMLKDYTTKQNTRKVLNLRYIQDIKEFVYQLH
ncbi:MAG: tRNA-dihydrouridine synthase family protein [Candidatus Bathyarchaeota archaeon]|uniref:tRNA dihydrouridine synthase n=1 Tax=Candidatus Bathycorpusculum sp. TaxID=2994959 RepID=UPI002834CFFE|nr:tRNA-dihydrouridine synthase family protein [Candidatus Termiticorpusculum sp.]MCL2257194.1 tRNA-dihydrouridine synthase family protein [Candidatus Termiticorpusculum sp.]MCL2292697.1 tRNA-dihydrouridine synthase family protein [Candidatus Termiticorpusculum sp.]